MPIIIKSTYSKKIGLPGYSSHGYSLTVETELSDISQLDRQSAQLWQHSEPLHQTMCSTSAEQVALPIQLFLVSLDSAALLHTALLVACAVFSELLLTLRTSCAPFFRVLLPALGRR